MRKQQQRMVLWELKTWEHHVALDCFIKHLLNIRVLYLQSATVEMC